jgi:hypothetical protein
MRISPIIQTRDLCRADHCTFSWDDLDAVIAPLLSVEWLHIICFGNHTPTTPQGDQLNRVANVDRKLPTYVAQGIVTEDVEVNEHLHSL